MMSERIINLRDSLSEQNKADSVAAIQIALDMEQASAEAAEDSHMYTNIIRILAALTITGIAIVTPAMRKTSMKQQTLEKEQARYQTEINEYKSKLTIAEDNQTKSKREIERLRKSIQRMNAKHEKTMKEYEKHKSDVMKTGYGQCRLVEDNGNISQWNKTQQDNFVEFYTTKEAEFADDMERSYRGLTSRYKILLILQHLGKSDNDIMTIMSIQPDNLRKMRSLINKCRITE